MAEAQFGTGLNAFMDAAAPALQAREREMAAKQRQSICRIVDSPDNEPLKRREFKTQLAAEVARRAEEQRVAAAKLPITRIAAGAFRIADRWPAAPQKPAPQPSITQIRGR